MRWRGAVAGSLALAALLLAAAAGGGAARAAAPVTVFAAASTTDALQAAIAAYRAAGGGPVRTSFAASSTLAKQIARGAPADLYLSADAAWMDYLAEHAAIAAGTRVDLLGNRLVLVAPVASGWRLTLGRGADLAGALGGRRLALGDPAHVPAGRYAVAALRSLELWGRVAGRTAYAGDVRAALALVARGEAAAGVVYATDARITDDVRVIDAFPADSHPAIVYPLAVVAGRERPAVRALYDFLRGARAREIFRAHGFRPPRAG